MENINEQNEINSDELLRKKTPYNENYNRKLYDSVSLALSTNKRINLSENDIHIISKILVDIVHNKNQECDEGFKSLYQSAVMDYENARNETHEIITHIEENYDNLLKHLIDFGVVRKEFDSKKKKNVLVGASKVVTKMVEFLNSLSDMVGVYYKDVYKIEETNKENNQGKLF